MAAKLNFDDLVESIQDAFIRVNDMSEAQHLNKLSEYFESDGTPKVFDMQYPYFDENGVPSYKFVSIPQICLVPISSLKLDEINVIINGAGAAATAIAYLLHDAGIPDITVCDRTGLIYAGRPEHMNPAKEKLAAFTNPRMVKGSLADGVKGADVFICVSAPGVLTQDMVRTMADKAAIFACANPTPEIFPDEAKAAGAAVVGTGRSDFPNQLNNALVFPGLFRGTFDVRASEINQEMKLAAAYALAGMVTEEMLSADYILPPVFDQDVPKVIAAAVAEAARKTGAARI